MASLQNQDQVTDSYLAGHVRGKAAGEDFVRTVMDRTDLSSHQKKTILRDERKKILSSRTKNNKELVHCRNMLALLDRIKIAEEDIFDWCERSDKHHWCLGRAHSSRMGALQTAIKEGSFFQTAQIRNKDDCRIVDAPSECLEIAHSFVVEHNWASAFSTASDFESEVFRLPFDICCFEFSISGKHVIALAMHSSDDRLSDIILKPFVEVRNGWFEGDYIYRYCGGKWLPDRASGERDVYRPMIDIIGSQIKAISVAIESEVAVADVVRQPHKLVQRRIKEGKVPPSDYHVVVLSRKSRAPDLDRSSSEDSISGKIRLHFRRGHWRHFETHKTWIKWMLVGNPDLGFIDKHYRL